MSDIPRYGDPGQPGFHPCGRLGSTDVEALRVEARSRDFVECGCCGQKLEKLYRRLLNAQMACAAVWMHVHHGQEFVHVGRKAPRHILRNRDYPRLALWGMLDQRPNHDPTKKDAGVWRLTDRGTEFALRRLIVPTHAFERAGNLEGWEDSSLDVVQALGKHFNYSELIRGEG